MKNGSWQQHIAQKGRFGFPFKMWMLPYALHIISSDARRDATSPKKTLGSLIWFNLPHALFQLQGSHRYLVCAGNAEQKTKRRLRCCYPSGWVSINLHGWGKQCHRLFIVGRGNIPISTKELENSTSPYWSCRMPWTLPPCQPPDWLVVSSFLNSPLPPFISVWVESSGNNGWGPSLNDSVNTNNFGCRH